MAKARSSTDPTALERELQAAREQQAAVARVLRVISRSAFELAPVLDEVLRTAARLCHAQSGVIFRRDGSGYLAAAAIGLDDEQRAAQLGLRTEPTRGNVIGRALLDRRPVQIPDVLGDPEINVSLRELQRKLGFRTMLGVPMLREGKPVGVISLRRNEVRPFSESELDLVATFADQAAIAIENVRLFNETKESLEQQTATADVLRIMSGSAFDLQPALEAVVTSAARLCEAHIAWLAEYDGSLIRPRVHYASEPRFEAAFQTYLASDFAPDPQSLMARSLLGKRTIHVPDLAADPGLLQHSVIARATGTRAALAVPLLRDRAIGGIVLARLEPRPFSDKQIRLVEMFADQAAIAIENVRLFNETKEALERQTATSEVLKFISRSAFELQPVLDAVVEYAARLTRASGFIYQLQGGAFRRATAYGLSEELQRWIDEHPVRPDDQGTLVGRVARQRSVIHIPDVLADPSYTYKAAQEFAGFRALLGVPLLRGDELIGVLDLWRAEPRAFTDREIGLVQTFADQAVIAIENVRLFDETKESLEQQTAVAGVLQVIGRSAFDLQSVLESVIERATKLAEAEQGFIYRLREDGRYHLAVSYQITPEFKEWTERNPLNPATRGTVTGRVVQERRAVHVPDVLEDPEYTYWEAQRVGKFRAILGVPLLREGVVVGVLILWRTEPRSFTDRQIQLVTTFADQAVIAIENARLFNEIQDKSRELELASRHKSEFLANMSHELRTPLNAIIGFSEVLNEQMAGPLTEKQAEYLADILESGKHLLSLINDILDLSKIEAGRMELARSTFSLGEALRNGLTMLRERASRHDIDLRLELAAGVDLITADERKIKQTLFNLLSNAVKFTPDGGRVDVRAERADGEVRISVSDTGIGIAPEDRERIFEEFQQAARSEGRSQEGTGLGLTLAKKFVELHGGRIWVESEVGKGATFTFAIPVGQTAAAPA